MTSHVLVLVKRATSLFGLRREPGERLKVTPLEAQALVANGKAELRNDTDQAVLRAAVQTADHQAASSAAGYFPTVWRGPR